MFPKLGRIGKKKGRKTIETDKRRGRGRSCPGGVGVTLECLDDVLECLDDIYIPGSWFLEFKSHVGRKF